MVKDGDMHEGTRIVKEKIYTDYKRRDGTFRLNFSKCTLAVLIKDEETAPYFCN